MSGTNSSRNKALLAGAVGAGVLLAGAGLFLYSHLEQKKKVDRLQEQLARLDISLSKLYQEILALRNNVRLGSSSSESKRSFSTSGDETETQYFSAQSSDDEDLVYECPSDAESRCGQKRDGKSTEPKSDSPCFSENQINEEELFEKVDVLMKGDDKDRLRAFHLLKKYTHKMKENVEFLWRFAKAHQIQAKACEAQNNLEGKKKHVIEGLEYATKALSLAETNPEVHKWFAILTGMQTDFVSVKQKIENGYLFQKHVLIAIEKKPEDYSLYHLLGRFKFELASISWFEKKIAASLFAELPEVTYKDAITDFLKAEELNTTPWKENRLLLAKCYLGNREYSVAAKWLYSAKGITPRTEEDAANDQQINLLLEKYKNYLK